MASRLLTIDAIAAMIDVSPRTVQREIDAGRYLDGVLHDEYPG